MRHALRTSALLFGLCSAPMGLHAQPQSGFTVREAGPDRFVVERARENGFGTEGFVMDQNALLDALRVRVLEVQGLGDLAHVTSVRPNTGRSKYPDSASFASAYTFRHSFSEPFQTMQARLDLAPLQDEGGFALLFQLSAFVLVAVILGLYALYRMVAVQVRFAERRGNFVAAVSHELKTPLTAIRLYAEMLRDGMVESDDKRAEYYATISSETERLSRLINNVLELSRLEQKERPLQLTAADVGPLVREVAELFRTHAEQHGFALEVQCEPGLPAVRIDRDALTQVLFNLLDNARKYGRGERRAIHVACQREGAGVCIHVRDSGPGVPEHAHKTIFEPFFRLEDELTRKQPGTGIGLSLVKGLVERQQGWVQAQNLHPGFQVTVHLPGA